MYDGRIDKKDVSFSRLFYKVDKPRPVLTIPCVQIWDRLLPIGLMWGNDPQLDQAAYDQGKRPEESWLNPPAVKFLKDLGGERPFWGYNDRLNGPADNFVRWGDDVLPPRRRLANIGTPLHSTPC